MSDEGLRKAYKYKLKPTPEQGASLSGVLWRCRTLYNTALEQRITAYRQRGVTLTCYQQQAELPDLKAAFPEYAAIHSPGLAGRVDAARQDLSGVLSPRARRGRRRASPLPGAQPLPLLHLHAVRQRRAAAITASSSCPRSAAWPCAGSRPLEGTPKTVTISHEADGWYAILSCAEVPAQPLPPTGRETGIDVG